MPRPLTRRKHGTRRKRTNGYAVDLCSASSHLILWITCGTASDASVELFVYKKRPQRVWKGSDVIESASHACATQPKFVCGMRRLAVHARYALKEQTERDYLLMRSVHCRSSFLFRHFQMGYQRAIFNATCKSLQIFVFRACVRGDQQIRYVRDAPGIAIFNSIYFAILIQLQYAKLNESKREVSNFNRTIGIQRHRHHAQHRKFPIRND